MRAAILAASQARYIFFCYFACKNRSVGAAILAEKVFLSNTFLIIFAFLITKLAMLGQQLVILVVYTYFRFFACKKCNMGVTIPVSLVKIVI